MEEQLRVLVVLGLVLILVLLRLDSRRFGVGEYDVRDAYGDRPPLLPRLAWYVAGIILAVAVYVVYPGDRIAFGFSSPDRTASILMGVGVGAFGIAQAVGIAYLRLGGIRPPRARELPEGIVNALGTAFVDEAAWRGIVLGLLLVVGVDPLVAILVQGIAYVLATRVGRTGADWYLVLLDLAIGLVGGWLTYVTAGIGAAVIAHAITRAAVFLATGSADAGPGFEELGSGDDAADWDYTDEDEEGYVDDATTVITLPGSLSAVRADGAGAMGGLRPALSPQPPAAALGTRGPATLSADDDLDDSDASLP